jgi:hypothetical protein
MEEQRKSHARFRRNAARVEAKVAPVGWRTTDEDEIAIRRKRAVSEQLRVSNLEADEQVFSSFRVCSPSGADYLVEIRSLHDLENSCSCPDFLASGLGTCKHVEAVLARLRRAPAAAKRDGRSPRAEVFLHRAGEPSVGLSLPHRLHPSASEVLRRYFGDDRRLRGDPAEAIPALVRDIKNAPTAVSRSVRVGRELITWAAERGHHAAREAERAAYLEDLRRGTRVLPNLRQNVYPYQVDGMLHLAFRERALLADDMGLGKTVQAIAACALLCELRGIARVLVVCPVSLKSEWEEQIERFTELPLRTVYGAKSARLAAYEEPPFFTIVNYEQAVRDVADINSRLRPDVVILDEAQRIKNWNTRTARTLKRLTSPYVFLLTGTPLENRIDEIYSIIELLDPQVFGPLFRFNREFYELDDRGRPVGYRNLAEMQRRIRPLLLRRRKEDIETQLPQRVDNNYFVPLGPAQAEMYSDFKERVARLAYIAKRRPLTRQEQEKLQKWLACMRMTCDTTYILSPDNRECPKLHELEAVLGDLDVRSQRKAIIFSEWQRMLELVRDLAKEMGLAFAWHTGEVPQQKRRLEIQRFKNDPQCRLLLSTDSGGVGLNLQAASVVINLDLPWNPARLEQRIARAWRKHQTQSVHVVNLISENTIEHQMLARIAAKRNLADGILDGRGNLNDLSMPTGASQKFIDQVQILLSSSLRPTVPALPILPPDERLRVLATHLFADAVVEVRVPAADSAGVTAALVLVRERPDAEVAATLLREWQRSAAEAKDASQHVEVVDVATWNTIQRLAGSGIIRVGELFDAVLRDSKAEEEARRMRAAKLVADARRKAKMATILAAAEFTAEALHPVREAVETVLRALATLQGSAEESDRAVGLEKIAGDALSEADRTFIASLRQQAPLDGGAGKLVQASLELVERLAQAADPTCGAVA